MLLEREENGAWRVTGLKLRGKRMGKKILLRMLFVCFQGVVED